MSETHSIIEQATQRAQHDWENQQVHYLMCGTVDTTKPDLDKESGFYIAIRSYAPDSSDRVFCNTYNKVITELIHQEGMPTWAPINRVPTRYDALAFLQDHRYMSDYKPGSIREKRIVESITFTWKIQPKIWRRVDNLSLLLLGGDRSKRSGRIDVIDSHYFRWMISFDYRRRHYPLLPWD